MKLHELHLGAAGYPVTVQQLLGSDAPQTIWMRGDLSILEHTKLALCTSVKCPGNVIIQIYDLARSLRDAGVTVIGGFHSPMEQECLRLLLRGRQPIIVCPARGIQHMRIPVEWRAPLDEGRLLLVSPFDGNENRVTAPLAERRNLFLAALADEVLIAYAAPGSKTEALARQVLDWHKSLYTLATDANQPLVALGARPVSTDYWSSQG